MMTGFLFLKAKVTMMASFSFLTVSKNPSFLRA